LSPAPAPKSALSPSRRIFGAPPGERTQPIASLEVFDDIACARDVWEELEARAAATPYQGYAFAKAWLATIAPAQAMAPMIVLARDAAGQPSALLPFVRVKRGPLWLAQFIGGKDANFNMGLFRPEFSPDQSALLGLLQAAARRPGGRIDAFRLTNQPLAWQGRANPLTALPGQPSPSFGHKSALVGDFPLWLAQHYSRDAQKKLRKKTQKLAELGALTHVVASDEAGARRILAAYAIQREARARTLGLPFEGEETAHFLTQAATEGLALGVQALELHALVSGERIVATFGGLAGAKRLCGMFISFDMDPDIARCSPGELLINEIVRSLYARGFAVFDLGVGEARYKDACCEADELLFDCYVATSAAGRVFAVATLLKQRLKRRIKQSPSAFALVKRLRRLRR